MLRTTLAATAIVFFFYILTNSSIRFLMSTVAERPTLAPTAGVGSDSNSSQKSDETKINSRKKLRNDRRSSRNKTIHEYERLHIFKKLCEDHAQLTLQIRGLLNALGDGKPAAESLTELDRSFQKLRELFGDWTKKPAVLKTSAFPHSLHECRDTASKVLETFNELGVFDNKFFGSLKEIRKHAKVIATKIDVEYGTQSECQLDWYLESIFGPLISELKTFVDGLKHIAEKDIEKIREAQDQRDQNLTTVATFLSGVTASTLQITIGDSDKALTTVINTLWFISLVFSTATAIYSLLSMIWRQSSVYRPNLALSTLADAIFHDGPVYALIAALLTFAIGLCLLAFLVANQEGVLASAIIPVAFAGVHACSISLFSTHLHAIRTKTWERACDLIRALWTRFSTEPKFRALRELVKATISTLNMHSIYEVPVGSDGDKGQPDHNDPSAASKNDQDVPTIPDKLSGGDCQGSEVAFEQLERLLQFSPDGHLLACAYENTVTIYDMEKSFSSICTIKTPDGNDVKEILWKPRMSRRIESPHAAILRGASSAIYFDQFEEKLLVKSHKSISVWNIQDQQRIQVRPLGCLMEEHKFVRWSDKDNEDVEDLSESGTTDSTGFICVAGTSIRNEECKLRRSFDLTKLTGMIKIDCVVGAVFCRKKYLFCLVNLPWDERFSLLPPSGLLLIDLQDKRMHSKRAVLRGHTSITLQSACEKILLHGGHTQAELVELTVSEPNGTLNIKEINTLWRSTRHGYEPSPPEEAVTFHGHNDKMIVAYSEDEIVMLSNIPGDNKLSALHIFTTTTPRAIPLDPLSFTINPAFSSLPYMFAFLDHSGTVTIWSIQSNTKLQAAFETFKVHDRCNGRGNDPIESMGRFLTIQSPSSVAPGSQQTLVEELSQGRPTTS
ncbi:hypothetical protein ACEPAH_7063 [Sanghuangporus vaninii]